MRTPATFVFLAAAVCLVSSPAAAQEWGDLKIRFVYGGEPPEPEKIAVTKDVAFCGQHELIDESLLVHPKNRGIKNVMVYVYTNRRGGVGTPLAAIHPSLEGQKKTVELTTQNCRFAPHILTMEAGDELLITPADPVGHNANINFFSNAPTGITIPVGSEQRRRVEKAEPAPIPVECNIHPWMKAYVLVADHPYAAVSDVDGLLTIHNLPAGQELAFRVWHESLEQPAGLEGMSLGDGTFNRRLIVRLTIAPGVNDAGEVVLPANVFEDKPAEAD